MLVVIASTASRAVSQTFVCDTQADRATPGSRRPMAPSRWTSARCPPSRRRVSTAACAGPAQGATSRRPSGADRHHDGRRRSCSCTPRTETESAVRTWDGAARGAVGGAGRGRPLGQGGRRGPRPGASGGGRAGCPDKWAATPPEAVMVSHQEAASGLAAIKRAIATGDWAPGLETYGDLTPLSGGRPSSVPLAPETGGPERRSRPTGRGAATRVPELC